MANNSTSLIIPAGYTPSTLSVSASASGGTIYAEASLYNAGTYWYGFSSCILSLQIDGVTVASIAPNFSKYPESATISGSRSVSDGYHTIKAVWTNPTTNYYIPVSGNVSCSVSTSTNRKSYLGVGLSTVVLGENLPITINSAKSSNTHVLNWSFAGQTGNTGVTSSRNWKVPIETFEPLIAETQAVDGIVSGTVTLTLNTYAGGSFLGSDTKTVDIVLPLNYLPTVNVTEVEYINPQNGSLIGGTSAIKLHYLEGVTPNGNSATVENVKIYDYGFIPSVEGTTVTGDIEWTYDDEEKTITSSTLPSYEGGSSYGLNVSIAVTDSRGLTVIYNLSSRAIGTIYSYVPPQFRIVQSFRCDEDGNNKPDGKYAYFEIEITNPDDSEIVTKSITIDEESYDFSLVEGEENTYSVIVGDNDLLTNEQYPYVVYVRNRTMFIYGDPAISQVGLLPTMIMPISYYDDGGKVGVSIGEMATNYSDIESSTFLNFAQGLMLRAYDNEGNPISKKAYDVLNSAGEIDEKIAVLREYILNTILGELKMKALTEVEYEDLEEKDENTIYFVYEEEENV